VQGNRPRASKLRASGVRAEREQRAGDATRRSDLARGYVGVPTVFLQHTRVSSGGLAREQESPEVRGGVGLANQFSSTVLSHGPRHPATPIPCRSSEQDHNTLRKLVNPLIELLRSLYAGTSSPWQSRLSQPWVIVRNIPPAILHPLQSSDKLLRHPRNLATIELFSSPILFIVGIHFPPFFSTTKVTPRFALIH
jgi:hypothetical protein